MLININILNDNIKVFIIFCRKRKYNRWRKTQMGLNVGSVYSANNVKPIIDSNALARVTEKILNPNNDKSIDISKLDLSKFNRVSLGTDLYASNTNGELALQAAKTAADFDLNLSKAFSSNVQYLNSQAAQSLFTSKENNGKLVLPSENINTVTEKIIAEETSSVSETYNTNKDRKGSNPFSFYFGADSQDNNNDSDSKINSINIFA